MRCYETLTTLGIKPLFDDLLEFKNGQKNQRAGILWASFLFFFRRTSERVLAAELMLHLNASNLETKNELPAASELQKSEAGRALYEEMDKMLDGTVVSDVVLLFQLKKMQSPEPDSWSRLPRRCATQSNG